MKRKSKLVDKLEASNFETELEFIPDSAEQIRNSVLRTGYDDILDQAFKAAIARVKRRTENTLKCEIEHQFKSSAYCHPISTKSKVLASSCSVSAVLSDAK